MECSLNFCRLILLYIKPFELVNIPQSLDYLFLLRKMDSPIGQFYYSFITPLINAFAFDFMHLCLHLMFCLPLFRLSGFFSEGNLFLSCVSRAVYLTDEISLILGSVDDRGLRSTGLIDKYAADVIVDDV